MGNTLRYKNLGKFSQKGAIPWNKNLKTGSNPEQSERMKGRIPWNKNLTKETDERVKKYCINMSVNRKGKHYSPKTEIKKGMTGNKSIAFKTGLPKCLDCGKILSHTKQKRCRKCSNAFHVGENTNNWKGGLSKNPYPIEFNRKLKLKIRQRDNFVCCLCGRAEREELEDFNRVLAVNHINFNKNDCKESNLNTLCLKCNTRVNREREYWTNYFNNQYD